MADFGIFFQQNLMLFGVAIALVFFIGTIEFGRISRKHAMVTPEQMVKLLNHEGTVLLDVREAGEHASGHVKSSRHVPAATLATQIDKLAVGRNVPVVVYCSTGTTSEKSCQLLHKSGFSKVYNLKGGFAAWQQAHLPVVRSKKNG